MLRYGYRWGGIQEPGVLVLEAARRDEATGYVLSVDLGDDESDAA
jgi:hypothetical protein